STLPSALAIPHPMKSSRWKNRTTPSLMRPSPRAMSTLLSSVRLVPGRIQSKDRLSTAWLSGMLPMPWEKRNDRQGRGVLHRRDTNFVRAQKKQWFHRRPHRTPVVGRAVRKNLGQHFIFFDVMGDVNALF